MVEVNEKKTRTSKLEVVNNQLKRILADYANLEKRVKEERETFVKFANQNLLLKLLPLINNLGIAAKKINDEGLRLVLKQFKDLLKSEGVEEIYPEKENFNPSFHEAVEVAAGKEGLILEVLEPGFKLNGKLLVAAKVKVGNGK